MQKITVSRLHTFTGHRDCIYTLASGAAPGVIFSGSGDGMVVAWHLDRPDEGKLLARLPHSVYALHFHEGSGMLVVGHNYEGIHLLHPAEASEKGSLQLTEAAIFDMVSHGNTLFVADGSGTVTVVDLPTLRILTRITLSQKSARSLALAPQKGHLAIGYSDHHVRVIDLHSLELIQEFKAHENSVFSLHYSPDESLLLSGSRDARLGVWDARAGYLELQKIVAHMYAINHIAYSPDGHHFATASMDKSVKVWDSHSLRLLKVIDKGRHAGHGTSVNKLLWTAHGNSLLSASDDRTISVWNIQFD
jgi:WD40 repeat protein